MVQTMNPTPTHRSGGKPHGGVALVKQLYQRHRGKVVVIALAAYGLLVTLMLLLGSSPSSPASASPDTHPSASSHPQPGTRPPSSSWLRWREPEEPVPPPLVERLSQRMSQPATGGRANKLFPDWYGTAAQRSQLRRFFRRLNPGALRCGGKGS
jgi:hypothetical protein